MYKLAITLSSGGSVTEGFINMAQCLDRFYELKGMTYVAKITLEELIDIDSQEWEVHKVY